MRTALAIVLVIGLVLGVGLVLLNQYVQSTAFKQAVLEAAHSALGADVTIDEIRVSLFSGVTLERVAVANPPGFPGNLLSADALVVRYRLLPLLRKRLEMEQVSLERPVLRLTRGGRGEWNYESLGAHPTQPPPRSAPRGPAPSDLPSPAAAGSALDIVLPKLAVNRGEVAVTGEKDRLLARLQQLDLATSVTWVGSALTGSGQARIETLNIADALFVRRLVAPLSFSASEVRLAPLAGTLADGDIQGDVTLRLTGGAKYVVNAQLRNADVERALEEAGARHRPLSGKLQLRATLEGTGGLATLVGQGRAEVLGGRLLDVPVLSGLAILLQVPELRDLRFEECRIEFTLADNVLRTPVIRLTSPDVQITGQGAVSLATSTLDHQLTLALAKGVLDRAPREVRAAFAERADGLLAVNFRVWGPYDAPKTDLSDRVLKGVAEGFLRRGLRKLFR